MRTFASALICGIFLVSQLPMVHSADQSAGNSTSAKLHFNRDIRPLLSDNCYFCHGPDKNHRQAELRLDLRQDAIDGKAIVPGDSQNSKLVERIRSTDSETMMPPSDSHKKLTPVQKQKLVDWIDQGAEYEEHWAYTPIVKPIIPANENGVDFLVRQRLNEIGLSFSPEADRRILIRRLYSDLLGLPPTPEDVDAFIQDSSADAYEKLVEKVLQSPHFGERMAIGWLDVVRFADTIGYHSDNARNVWPYRDWVIKSFNDNKAFDRFTVEQIAGDLLPDANDDTRVGSAFNRLLLTTEEGGAQAKDYEARMLTDRVRAIGATWLGQTTGCAQCHDHKFDPFTMRDFYGLGAFFADIEEGILGRREDGMLVLNKEQQEQLGLIHAKRDAAKNKLQEISPFLDVAQKQWESDLRKYKFTLPELQPDSKASPADLKAAQDVVRITEKDDASRNPQEKQIVTDYYRNRVNPLYAQEVKLAAETESQAKQLYETLPKCLVSKSTANKRIVRILPRGNWMDESGEVIKPAIPHYLPQPKVEGRELNRLDLANWIVSRENPLTARTTMNRLWKQFFGAGISKVLDDLGAQGESPVNPLLLDWLAAEFVDQHWDLKQMVRLIVTSKTYKQVSTVTTEQLAKDPYNREYARQSRFRLDAELIRDHALAVSGLLVRKIGGPSVKPYQPDRYWENLNFPTRDYQADKGENQYRRGIYTWWQRSFLHPSLLAFDAPNREECTAERNRSNIPQQALILLNDPSYVEAARVFASRIMKECDSPCDERIKWSWHQALQRTPSDNELKTVQALYDENLRYYSENATAAQSLTKIGQAPVVTDVSAAELAAWTHVARVVLNLHETITRN